MQETWWNVPLAKETAQTFQKRVHGFQTWLYEIPQKTVVLIGHGNFLREFMRGTPSESTYMRNTELRIMEFPALPYDVVLLMDTAIVTCGLRYVLGRKERKAEEREEAKSFM
jgi:broad specificity phosphatase PhoE